MDNAGKPEEYSEGGSKFLPEGIITDVHKDKLVSNYDTLVEKLQNASDIMEYLTDRNYFTEEQKQIFFSKPTAFDKNRYLIQTLLKRGERAYHEFVTALTDTQDTPELYQLLRDDSMPEVETLGNKQGPPKFGLAKKYYEQLRAFHRRNLLKVASKRGHTYDLQSYISLTLYSQNSKVNDLRGGYQELSGIDAVRALGPPIDAQNLFEIVNPEDEEESPRTVLLLGSPGVGKTATAYHFLQETIEGRLWASDIQFVFFLLLRELNHVKQNLSLKSLFLNSHGPETIKTDKIWEVLMKNQSSILAIFDGYDELEGLGTNEDKSLQFPFTDTTISADPKKLIYNVITGNLIGDCKVLVTSRPHCSEKLSSSVSRIVELDGLDTEKINVMGSYILEGNLQLLSAVMEYLDNHSNVKNLLRSPINAKGFFNHVRWTQEVTVNEEFKDSCFPKTRAALLYMLILNMLRHHDQALFSKYRGQASESKILQSRKTLIKKLANLAYSALLRKKGVQQLFSEDDLAEHGLTVEEVTQSALMTSHTSAIAENFWNVKVTFFAFLHLTLQEFFAALELCNMPWEVLESVSHDHQGERDMLLQFTLGAMADAQCQPLLTALYHQAPTNVCTQRLSLPAITANASMQSSPTQHSVGLQSVRRLRQSVVRFFRRRSSRSNTASDISTHCTQETSTIDVYIHKTRCLLTAVCTSPRRFLQNGVLFCLHAFSESKQYDMADLIAPRLLNVFNSLNFNDILVNTEDSGPITKFLGSLSCSCDHVVLAGRLDVSSISNVVCTGGFKGLLLSTDLSKDLLSAIGQTTDPSIDIRYLMLIDKKPLSCDVWSGFKPSAYSRLKGFYLEREIDDGSLQAVCSLLQPLPALQALRLTQCPLPDLSSMAELKQVVYLYLYNCQLGSEAIKVLSNLVAQNPLLWLDLTKCAVGDSGAVLLADSLQHPHAKLTGLVLRDCGLGCDGARVLFSSLEHNTHLSVLDMSTNAIAGSEEAMARALGISAIEELYLWRHDISPEEGCLLVTSLMHNRKLRWLGLSRNTLNTQEFAMSLKCMLHHNKHLQALEVDGCGMTTEMLSTIFSGLKHNTCLKLLNIGVNPKLSSRVIAKLLVKTRIEYLCLAECELGKEGWREIGQALRASKHMAICYVGDKGKEEDLEGLLEEMYSYPSTGPLEHLILNTQDRTSLVAHLSHLHKYANFRVSCIKYIYPFYVLSGLWYRILPADTRTWMYMAYFNIN